MQSGADDLAW